MSREKVESALSAALKYLGDSLRAMSNNGDEKTIADSLWSASAETEYAVFLLSLTQRDKTEGASWKHGSSSKQPIEFKPALTSAQELLQTARANVGADNLEKAYEETWTARNLLLKAQELLEKRRKEAKK